MLYYTYLVLCCSQFSVMLILHMFRWRNWRSIFKLSRWVASTMHLQKKKFKLSMFWAGPYLGTELDENFGLGNPKNSGCEPVTNGNSSRAADELYWALPPSLSWSVVVAERSHGLRGGIFQINAWDGEVSLRDSDRPESDDLREISRSLLPPEPPRPCPSRCSHPWYELLYVSCSQSFYFAANLLIWWEVTGF